MVLKLLASFLVVLMLSCIFNSVGIWMGILPNYPPYPWGSRIEPPGPVKSGVKREENQMPEVDVTNGIRGNGFIYQVEDSGERSQADFPYCANF